MRAGAFAVTAGAAWQLQQIVKELLAFDWAHVNGALAARIARVRLLIEADLLAFAQLVKGADFDG